MCVEKYHELIVVFVVFIVAAVYATAVFDISTNATTTVVVVVVITVAIVAIAVATSFPLPYVVVIFVARRHCRRPFPSSLSPLPSPPFLCRF